MSVYAAMRCEECDDLYPQRELVACSECGLLLCAACEYSHDCSVNDEDDVDDEDIDWDDDGWDLPRSREAQEAKMVAWNHRVAEWNAGQREA